MDTSKSLQALEGYDEGDPKGAPTPMIRRCLELHRTPLAQFSAEDCRLMIGQGFGLEFLVPLATEFLSENPFPGLVPGVLDPGLLRFVLRLPADFWRANPEFWWMLQETVLEVEMLRDEIIAMTPVIENFRGSQPQ